LSVDFLLSIWQHQGRIKKPGLDFLIGFEPFFYEVALRQAQTLRAEGYSVILDVQGLGREQALIRASELKARTFLFYCQGGPFRQQIQDRLSEGE